MTVISFQTDGTRTTPTILGLNAPSGVALSYR